MSINKVIKNDYCNGCGGCKLYSPDSIDIEFKNTGFYKANIKSNTVFDKSISEICPFSDDSIDETTLAKELFNKSTYRYDERVGFFSNIYVGNVRNENSRITSSSGGLTTFIAKKLLELNEVDAIVHVGFDGVKFNYLISKTSDELDSELKKKSRYAPVTFDSISNYLINTTDKVALIGVPCFIKSIRLLQKKHKLINVTYCISLLCGHMKSAFFGEALSWQIGISPNNLSYVDFRVKKEGYESSNYFIEATDKKGNKREGLNSALLGSNWGLGFFRHKSCSHCDDIAGELSDVTLGDAWLPEYTKDYLGKNILVVRNEVIADILENNHDKLTLKEVDVETFFRTQSGNYGNRRGGIVAINERSSEWLPKKRMEICYKYKSNKKKQKVYLYRSKLSEMSIKKFLMAKKLNSFFVFKILMLPSLLKYRYMTSGFLSAMKYLIPTKFKKIIRVFKK
ncbi:Coenzyme F420 hydrogenase/dehydrogenase, beta subunit C-terminal domain [Photobacterium leiognathi]|uniref:Coenzyme F420 hydrogenase/dehydrogenase, beta subunit C-terminal domain n=1 Tax=Photobacterium leiognathi TaxID=553611 RepID=UPI002980FE52|nr:Coenzyme F420 hydrogenase/dehydrogenase, beta subunit C-terminal domain [Photobacterium leiognathi]